MKKARPVDLGAVREARATLERIAKENPELIDRSTRANREKWEAALEAMESDDMAGETKDAQLVVRLPQALVDRVDAYAERLREEMAGAKISRADAVRVLLTRALETSEGSPRADKRRR